MQDTGGLMAYELGNGTMIDGRRVVGLRRGMRNGDRVVTVFVEGKPGRKGRVRPVELGTFALAATVPGTRTPTTWAMPAGPVGRKPGGKLHGGWYGDADERDGRARADRNQRMIHNLVYA